MNEHRHYEYVITLSILYLNCRTLFARHQVTSKCGKHEYGDSSDYFNHCSRSPHRHRAVASFVMASNVDAKLLKSTKFPAEFNQKVDMQKVNVEVMKK